MHWRGAPWTKHRPPLRQSQGYTGGRLVVIGLAVVGGPKRQHWRDFGQWFNETDSFNSRLMDGGASVVVARFNAHDSDLYTVEPLCKGQECLTKVVKFGPFPHTILYKSCLFYPFWNATILGGLYWGVPLYSLKRECSSFDEIFINCCTGSCQNDNVSDRYTIYLDFPTCAIA